MLNFWGVLSVKILAASSSRNLNKPLTSRLATQKGSFFGFLFSEKPSICFSMSETIFSTCFLGRLQYHFTHLYIYIIITYDYICIMHSFMMFIYVYIYMYELFHVSNLYWGLKIFAPCFRANSSEPSCESNQVTRQKHLTKVPQNGWFIINGKPYEQMG